MPFMCECRGPCRCAVDITPDTYRWLRTMGAVLTPECADREDRFVLYRYNDSVVVALTIGAYALPPGHPSYSLHSRT